jgi:tetratricopeptide (TPR) repeat protein
MQHTDTDATHPVHVQTAVIFALLLSLLACAPQPVQESPVSSTVIPESSTDSSSSSRAIKPAVAALLRQADQFIQQQRWPDALSNVERAIRIDSTVAESWTRMALIHLGKNDPEQALNMAKKSNSLARQNKSLQAYNWSIMGRAYDRLNNPQLSQQAYGISQRLQQDSD